MSFPITFAVFSCLAVTTEAVFTGIGDRIRDHRNGRRFDWELPARTWLWSIPVYGLSAAASFTLIAAWTPGIFVWPWPLRGLVYMLGIYAWEFSWGWTLEQLTGLCPWQYCYHRKAFFRFCKLAYAPFWFGFGLLLEAVYRHVISALA